MSANGATKVLAIAALLAFVGPAAAQSTSVPRYEVFEAAFTSAKSYANPYTGVTLTTTYTSPSGRKLTAIGFHDGGSTWRSRLAPDEVGSWSYVTSASDSSDGGLHNRSGSFTCTSSTNHGFVKPDPTRKYNFSYSDGTPFYGMGDTCYGLLLGISDSQRISYLDKRASQGFNFIRIDVAWTSSHHSSLSQSQWWPMGGTPSSPDLDRFNPAFFQRFESVLGELKARNLLAEVIVFNYYGDANNWMPGNAAFNDARQKLWARYLVSRLAAYTTVFLWTGCNEYETFPNYSYSYSASQDDPWARSMADVCHQADPNRNHATTTHPFIGNPSTGDRFGTSSEMDVLTHQSGPGGGSGETTNSLIWKDRIYNKPVINTESGYEGNGGAATTDWCRRQAWLVFTAGGASSGHGFQGTWNGASEVVPWSLSDLGLGTQLGYFINFVKTTEYWKMSPSQSLVNSPNLCLANAGAEYVVYAPSGGTVTLNLTSASGNFSAEWLNPRTGTLQGQTTVSGGASRSFGAPDGNDWVLHLKSSGGSGGGGLPDVILTSFAYANGIFTCTVKNQGSGATPSGVSIGVGYSVDGTWRSYGMVSGPLAAGASVAIGTNGSAYTIPNGTHTITAYVDDVNRFAESNENNNVYSVSVSVGGGSAGTGTGLTGQYYDNIDLTALKVTRTDATVNFDWGTGSPDGAIAADTYSVRWTGQVQGQFSETHTFYTVSDDGVRLWVNGQLLINNWTNHSATENSGSISLTAGQKVDLKMEFFENGGDAVAKLLWSSPSVAKQTIPQSQLYPSGVVAPPPPSSLVGRWKLDDGGGSSAADASGLGNTGSLINGPSWTSGTYGGGLSFDGVDDKVQVPDSSSLDLTSQGTIGVWVYPRSLPDGYAGLAEKFGGGGQGAGYQLLMSGSNSVELWLMSGGVSTQVLSAANIFGLNAWTHVAVTWNGSTVQFYKNGQPFGSAQAQPGSAGANTLPLVIGADSGYTGRLNGILDDLQIHNRGLTATEVQSVWQGQ